MEQMEEMEEMEEMEDEITIKQGESMTHKYIIDYELWEREINFHFHFNGSVLEISCEVKALAVGEAELIFCKNQNFKVTGETQTIVISEEPSEEPSEELFRITSHPGCGHTLIMLMGE